MADAEKELPWQSLARSNPSSCAGPPPSLDRTASEAEGAFTQRTRRLNPRNHHGMILLVIIDLCDLVSGSPEPPLMEGEVEVTGSTSRPGSLGHLLKIPVRRRDDVAAGTARFL